MTDIEDETPQTDDTAAAFSLYQNFPNPFTQQTVISYQLPVPSQVSLQVYNIAGQLVKTLATGDRPLGAHEVAWNGKNEAGEPVGSGIYFYRLETQGHAQIKRLVLIR